MNVIIPDTNVMLSATFNTVYEGIIPIRDRFYDESSRLLDVIKDEITYPNVGGILLPQVKGEYRIKKILSKYADLYTVAVAQKIVEDVMKKIEKEVPEDAEAVRLQDDYFHRVKSDIPKVKYPRDILKLPYIPESGDIAYLLNLYSVLPVVDIDWKKYENTGLRMRLKALLQDATYYAADYTNLKQNRTLSSYRLDTLWNIINCEIDNDKRLDDSSVENAVSYCFEQMKELKKGLEEINNMPKTQLSWHAKNETTHAPDSQLAVKKMFDDLFAEYKNTKLPLQLAEHKKSEENGHSHDYDKLILAQIMYLFTIHYILRINEKNLCMFCVCRSMNVNSYQVAIHKKLIDDPESEIHRPNCKIYIASNDMKFFRRL